MNNGVALRHGVISLTGPPAPTGYHRGDSRRFEDAVHRTDTAKPQSAKNSRKQFNDVFRFVLADRVLSVSVLSSLRSLRLCVRFSVRMALVKQEDLTQSRKAKNSRKEINAFFRFAQLDYNILSIGVLSSLQLGVSSAVCVSIERDR